MIGRVIRRLQQALPIRFEWSVHTPGGEPIEASCGIRFETRRLVSRPAAHAVVVVGPGITSVPELREQLVALTSCRARLRRWLSGQRDAGALVAASCSGVFVLAELGLLGERTVTTTWWLAGEFRRRYDDVNLHASAMVVPDGPFVTAGAAMAHLDLALYLIRQFAGAELSQRCARYTVTDVGRRSQALYAIPEQMRSSEPLVGQAMSRLAQRRGLELTVTELARALGVTPRTLHRRLRASVGLTPQAFIACQRIRRAKGLLEATALPIDVVAQRIGFGDLSAFCRAFKRDASVTPAAYRRAFRLAP